MKTHKSEPTFRKVRWNWPFIYWVIFLGQEQFNLYQWRERYFFSQKEESTNWFVSYDKFYDDDDGITTTATVPYQVKYEWLYLLDIDHQYCIFSQITQNFDMVVALASHPQPTLLGKKIYFEQNEDLSANAMVTYDSSTVSYRMEFLPDYLAYSYSEAVYIILALFQNQPLSLEVLAMKKILQFEMEVKRLPSKLKAKAENFFKSSDQILPYINEKGKKIMESDFWHGDDSDIHFGVAEIRPRDLENLLLVAENRPQDLQNLLRNFLE